MAEPHDLTAASGGPTDTGPPPPPQRENTMRTYEQIMADADDEPAFSNSTGYEIWANNGKGCYDCANDDAETEKYCPILGAALMGVWPREWERVKVPWSYPANESLNIPASSGETEEVGECSQFVRRPDDDDGPDEGPDPDPGPTPVIEGQIDIFEIFTDQVIEGLPAGHLTAAH